MIYNLIAVFIGGGFGAVMRFLVSNLCQTFFQLPILGTLTVNLVGCFLIGLMYGLMLDKLQGIFPILKLLITVGFLGGLTTFSTFCLEGFVLMKSGRVGLALLYIACSNILGLLFVFIGCSISKS